MKKAAEKIGYAFLIVFLLIQFYRPTRNSGFENVTTNHFTNSYDVPSNVKAFLRTACYDCHSNYTNYPWYANIQPISLFMETHIQDGKTELNFSELGSYSKRRQHSKLEAISEEIQSGEMPLNSYTLMHKEAQLSKKQKDEIINWINLVNP